MSKIENSTLIFVLLIISFISLFAGVSYGPSNLGIFELIGSSSKEVSRILWDVRLPRVVLAFVVGAGLSLCGLLFQTLFRNPLATPFTLGVASGASFGAAFLVVFSGGVMGSLFTVRMGAFLGAIATVVLVYCIATRIKLGSSLIILLVGVVLSFFFSSAVLFLQYLADPNEVFRISRWMMGSLETVGFEGVSTIAIFTVALGIISIMRFRSLELYLLGHDIAAARGLNVTRFQRINILGCSIVTALIVAQCGIIGFIGLIVPYICRTLFGLSYFRLVLGSIFLGGAFLVVCDLLSRSLMSPVEIPIGVITALLGGPFFLMLLFVKKRDGTSNLF